jgi:DNA-directed RNA polymerase subunit K/omega
MSLTYKAKHIDDVRKTMENIGKETISKPIMTKYEFDKIIGLRTVQLASGSMPFVNIDRNIESNMELRQIALKELMEGRLPFIVERSLPYNKKECIPVRNMSLVAVKDRMR